MNYPVYYQEKPVAQLQCEACGLYRKLSLSCAAPPERYLFCSEQETPPVCLGTLVPEGKKWRFCKTVSQRQLPLRDGVRFFLSAKSEAPIICGKPISGGEIRTENGRRVLRFPLSEAEPFALVGWARYFSILELDGKTVLQCALDAENTPVFVDIDGNCDTINAVS